MNQKTTYFLSYFLGRTFFLGFGFSLILSMVAKDAWISFILGTLLGIIIIYFLSLIKEKMQNRTLKEYAAQNKIVACFLTLLFLLFNIVIMNQILFILETFASSFFLIESPPFYILIPVFFIIIRINKYPETLGRIAEILMPISLLMTLFSLVILTPSSNFTNFLPIMTHSSKDMILSTLFFAVYSSAPFLLLLDTPLEKPKLILPYLIPTITIILTGVLIIGVLGNNLIQIYRYPEYMLLKKIKVFAFLEKIENIVSVTWVFDTIMTLSLCEKNVQNLLPKKEKKSLLIIILGLLYFSVIYLGKIYAIELQIYHILPMILGAISIILLTTLFLYQKKNKKKSKTT